VEGRKRDHRMKDHRSRKEGRPVKDSKRGGHGADRK